MSSETLNIVGPIGTVVAVVAGLYWALQRGKLIVGSQHVRELAAVEKARDRENTEHDVTLKAMREDFAVQIAAVRGDAVSAAARRESENAATIAGLRDDVMRMYGAWQIEAGARERVTSARDDAVGQGLLSILEAVRAGPMGNTMPARQLETGERASDDG